MDAPSNPNVSTPPDPTTTVKDAHMYEAYVVDTAAGALVGLVALLSVLKTASWQRRTASAAPDLRIVWTFLLFYAGDVANVLVLVTVATGLYCLTIHKGLQQVPAFLPLNPQEDKHFVTYVVCAFALKAVQLLHQLMVQLSVDVFFIDWEKPRTAASRTAAGAAHQKRDLLPVSIWRTYFVANEWNELQTVRKIRPTFQILAVLFFLKALGFWEYTVREPWPPSECPQQEGPPSYSPTVRFGLAATLWLGIGLVQVIFTVFYEICVEDKIRHFVDLCSMSNISVLLLAQRCFGYYIHGRSVHGHADTNMEEMNNNLRREAESLCGQRGLLPSTEIQTFQVALSTRLRSQYDRIRESFATRYGPARLTDPGSVSRWEQNIRAYHAMNFFLASIIDHVHPDMDYYVRDKLALERIMGVEFLEPIEKSIFYNDKAHSFSDALFYGHESTLLSFDAFFFCVVDLACRNFVLAGLLTYSERFAVFSGGRT
ncbi:meckelin-like isoform X2 [Syngnathoides biaculeatus]|uniref:meckelin-like isoform X2 n=1 Tax=Syngnathoides biaculeatus TaxID=300417 RepID=UPI002ADD9C19|nr:meckelin-like isoform X2 [Syngnathoides biaculeatus]